MNFKVDHTANATGTCLQGKMEIKYTDLVRLFGEPATIADNKVSVEWTFVNEDGDIVTLYDWKSNDLSFKTSNKPYVFHIGAKSLSVAWEFGHQLEILISKL
jgi:hypothetical protein